MQTALTPLTLRPKLGVFQFHFIVRFQLLHVELRETGTAVLADDWISFGETSTTPRAAFYFNCEFAQCAQTGWCRNVHSSGMFPGEQLIGVLDDWFKDSH